MKILRSKYYLLLFILPFSCIVLFSSCEKKDKETKKVTVKEKIALNSKTTISQETLTLIAESNLKIVAISQKAREAKLKNSTRNVLKEVEENHIQIKEKIRKIAKDNYIIIPNTLYNTSILKKLIGKTNVSLYLKKLENSLNLELELYQKINASILNKDLKILCEQTMPIIENNITIVNDEQKDYHKYIVTDTKFYP